ncbi:MAG: hypothetical protein PHZ19_01535 [Candidatus Thermoplasmatota archaeon]|nr:hypothetical protein [Candidatus Thermoplasmatota archaeon]
MREGVVIEHGGWIIRRYAHGYIFHHKNDKKMNHAKYPGSLAQALALLHEQILLDNRFKNGSDASIESFRRALVETQKEFRALLSPDLGDVVNEE